MKSIVIVLLFVVGVCLPESSFAQKGTDCPEIKVTISAKATSDGQSNGKIEFKFDDQSKATQYNFLLTPQGEETVKGTKDGFKNLKAGHYDVYVVDKKGCLKQAQVQVK